ncbi:MAG: hypothetical protein AMXMBFR19_21420 [Chthonomonadaceae bacterium]|uniref:FeS-binding protein n=1 Tax=Candidatus Nitrosymbiomonas proteolyticus TaxID=2608984 RepID=A0A809RCD6_9BACT|nr:FeS-binding protein [Candidatus Nitrosymbiomonas proteolyticus]
MVAKVDVTLVAANSAARQPWIWRLARDFNVVVNVKRASIDEDRAWALVELDGPIEEIQRAIAWLMTTGLHVESHERALGA